VRTRYDFLKDASIGVLSTSALLLTLILALIQRTPLTKLYIVISSMCLVITIVLCTGALWFGTFGVGGNILGIKIITWLRSLYLAGLTTFMVSLLIVFFAILLTL
jgi:hypothetical protein